MYRTHRVRPAPAGLGDSVDGATCWPRLLAEAVSLLAQPVSGRAPLCCCQPVAVTRSTIARPLAGAALLRCWRACWPARHRRRHGRYGPPLDGWALCPGCRTAGVTAAGEALRTGQASQPERRWTATPGPRLWPAGILLSVWALIRVCFGGRCLAHGNLRCSTGHHGRHHASPRAISCGGAEHSGGLKHLPGEPMHASYGRKSSHFRHLAGHSHHALRNPSSSQNAAADGLNDFYRHTAAGGTQHRRAKKCGSVRRR